MVSVDDSGVGENLVAQVLIAVSVCQLVEKPVRRAIEGTAAAIGVEGGFMVPRFQALGDLPIGQTMP